MAALPLAFAQSEPKPRDTESSQPAAMSCPMMEMMSATPEQMAANKEEMMSRMRQRKSSMFALSGDEISALLTEKRGVLELSEHQAERIAELIVSSQQEKTGKTMRDMMKRMQAGQMQCSCGTSSVSK